MKNYNKPELIEEVVIVEDVIAASNYISKTFSDLFKEDADKVEW